MTPQKQLTILFTGLVATSLLAGCGQGSASAPTGVSLATQPSLATSSHVAGNGWTVTQATFVPLANEPGFGTTTITLAGTGHPSKTIAVFTFFNHAPRVLNQSIYLEIDGYRDLGGDHYNEVAALLADAKVPAAHKVVVKKALSCVQDKKFTRY